MPAIQVVPCRYYNSKSTIVKRLDIDKVAENIVNYFLSTDKELKNLMAPIGNSSLPVGRSDALLPLINTLQTDCKFSMFPLAINPI